MRKIAVFAIAILSVSCIVSCTGRHADATPNGETVEVKIEPVAVDTVSGQMQDEEVVATEVMPGVDSVSVAK